MITMINKNIISSDGKHRGVVKSLCPNRPCHEGCNGTILYVKWEDGKKSYPCTSGLMHVSGDDWRIM